MDGETAGKPRSWHREAMRIERIGFTPLKGGRHRGHDTADLTPTGPVGDRVFCLVDPARGRVLRTVENPSLLRTAARWDAGVLSVHLPDRTLEGSPSRPARPSRSTTGGVAPRLEVVDGPWSAAFSEHLGYDVVLARSVHAGEIVYGASVTLVTTASIACWQRRAGGSWTAHGSGRRSRRRRGRPPARRGRLGRPRAARGRGDRARARDRAPLRGGGPGPGNRWRTRTCSAPSRDIVAATARSSSGWTPWSRSRAGPDRGRADLERG